MPPAFDHRLAGAVTFPGTRGFAPREEVRRRDQCPLGTVSWWPRGEERWPGKRFAW
jgi:hypothetical protein